MSLYRFSSFSFDPDSRELQINGESHFLRKKVADVLSYLLKHRDRIVSKEELLDNIWEQGEYRESSLLQSIRELRKLFNDSAQNPEYIRTIYLKGYQWVYKEIIIEQANSNKEEKTSVTKAPVPPQEPEQAVENNETAASHRLTLNWPRTVTIALTALLLLWIFTHKPATVNGKHDNSLAVLPFTYKTQENLSRGQVYADIVSSGLRQISTNQVIPTYHLNRFLAQKGITNTINQDKALINSLIYDMQIEYLISIEVEAHEQQFKINYQIHNVDEVINSGSITASDPLTALPSLIKEINANLNPDSSEQELDKLQLPIKKQAQNSYIQGLISLKQDGPKQAIEQFEEALKDEPNSLVINERMAYSLYILGEWAKAKTRYNSLLNHSKLHDDPYLASLVYDGLATLLIQQGEFQTAGILLEQALSIINKQTMRFQKAKLLKTKAKLRKYQHKYNERKRLLEYAYEQSQPFNFYQVENEQLYYLGGMNKQGLAREIQGNENQTLLSSLSHYSQAKNLSEKAKTMLAIGQNPLFSIEERSNALAKAGSLFKEQGLLSLYLDYLSYSTYFHLQIQQGQQAKQLIQRAIDLSGQLAAKARRPHLEYLKALSYFEQGRDRGQGQNLEHLKLAQKLLTDLMTVSQKNKSKTEYNQQDGDVFLALAWVNSELKESLEASLLLNKALDLYQQLNANISAQYAINALAQEELKQEQWQNIIALAKQYPANYLLLSYTARAYYQQADYKNALRTFQQVKLDFNDKWTDEDEIRLQIYTSSFNTNEAKELGLEQSAYLKYNEDI